MAYGIYGSGEGGNKRNTLDDEYDRIPGNSGISREYAEKYDRRSEQEFSNRLETANQIEEARILAEISERNQRAFEDIKDAQSSVHFFPSVGKFVIPEENTWAAHAALVKDDKTELNFNPEKYIYFDKIIAKKFKNPALTDPSHPDYAKFEGLRTNIEVMRNDIIGMYLDDGAFDPGDEKYIPKIAGIAAALGEALNHDTWWKRPFTRSLSVDVANVEGVGAREMYRYLLDVQDTPAKDTPIYNFISGLLGIPNRSWQLQPLENTPYSDHGLSAPPPQKETAKAISEAVYKRKDDIDREIDRVKRSVSLARRLNTPESLDAPTQEQSIDEARTILRYLKNLQGTNQTMEEWLDLGTPEEQRAKSEAVSRLIELYAGQVKMAAAHTPSIVNSLVISSANEAAGTLALSVAGHTLDNLAEDNPRIITLEDVLTNLPDSWIGRQNHSVDRLLEIMETGMEWASGKDMNDKAAIDRLVEMSGRIHANARKLQSIDTLQAPARIESVELAREILRKMKGLGFANKPVEEMIAPGNVENKAALAERVDEMVEIYKNLLAEVAETNPNIMNDRRIREANEAVGQFSHTIKLMAAKELPSSMAAAQQISADIAQMPEEWKKLDGRTMDRLVQSMEGGVQQAVSELQAQQEQQQRQDEELSSQKASDDAQLLGNARRRRKRRSGGKSTPALTKAAKRRNAGDLNGDGIADRFQNLGLNDKDLIAVKQLGGSLRNISEQAGNLAPPADVPASNPLADDRSFAERADPARAAVDQQRRTNQRNNGQRSGNTPRNNQRPQI